MAWVSAGALGGAPKALAPCPQVPLEGETLLADVRGTDGPLARSFPSATAPRHGLIVDAVTLTPLTGSKPIRIRR
jgi:hypothetical protein